MKILIYLVAFSAVAVFGQDKAVYNNYQVHKVTPRNQEQINFLRELEEYGDFSFWSDIMGVNHSVNIMVAPHQRSLFQDFVTNARLEDEVYIKDVQQLIDTQNPIHRSNRFDFKSYHRLSEINQYLVELSEQYSNVKLITGGRSYEGRDIMGIHISFGKEENGVFLEGGIHAREWIAPATVMYITTELLNSNDPNIRQIAESHDWYIFPVFNPDGYEYTFQKDRLWRKTRQPHGSCYGADPNRNWGYHWMDGGASSFPCSETYAGSSAFSEPETKSMSEYISTINKKIVAYIAFHSFSQLLLIPYGHSSAHVENYNELYEIGMKSAKKLSERYGTRYTVGNIVETIYVASGGSMDWVKGTHGTRITYTYELRDTGRYGFLLPADQILPTGQETMDSLVEMLSQFSQRK